MRADLSVAGLAQQRYLALSLPRRLGPTRMPVEECEAEWRRSRRSGPSSQILRVLACTLTSKLMDCINRGHLCELNTFPRKRGKAGFQVACASIVLFIISSRVRGTFHTMVTLKGVDSLEQLLFLRMTDS